MPVVKHGDKYGIGSGEAMYDDPRTAWRAYYGYLKHKYGSVAAGKQAEGKDPKGGDKGERK